MRVDELAGWRSTHLFRPLSHRCHAATTTTATPPQDEFLRQDLTMAGLLDLEDLQPGRSLLLPDAPHPLADDDALEPCARKAR
jgi:hypothetical protein